jgi:hypothetical protein
MTFIRSLRLPLLVIYVYGNEIMVMPKVLSRNSGVCALRSQPQKLAISPSQNIQTPTRKLLVQQSNPQLVDALLAHLTRIPRPVVLFLLARMPMMSI